MSRPAVFAHPAMLTSPDRVEQLEAETGMKCQREGTLKVRMVPVMDDYDLTDRLSYLGDPDAFAEEFGRIA